MLSLIKRFFDARIAADADSADAAPAAREHALQLAAAALLFEVVRADGETKPSEMTVMRAGIQASFGLGRAETDELVRLAEQESKNAISLYEFTRLIDRGLSAEHKKRVIELLWMVAFADDEKGAHEEHLVRKIAGLLHVAHPDFIDAKIRAKTETAARK